jgi:hypothetical protein
VRAVSFGARRVFETPNDVLIAGAEVVGGGQRVGEVREREYRHAIGDRVQPREIVGGVAAELRQYFRRVRLRRGPRRPPLHLRGLLALLGLQVAERARDGALIDRHLEITRRMPHIEHVGGEVRRRRFASARPEGKAAVAALEAVERVQRLRGVGAVGLRLDARQREGGAEIGREHERQRT